MIRLKRPRAAPASLKRLAAKETAKLWRAWNVGNPLEFNRAVYGNAEVKKCLDTAQAGKCAYCETKFVRDYGQVEHYRPKAGWRQSREDGMTIPGYFWLAYRWTNLLKSCAMCNDQGHKANLFPLADPMGRASPIQSDVRGEAPLVLNPFKDDPEAHITWREDMPKACNQSIHGAAVIETFHLDTDEKLVDERRSCYELIKAMLECAEMGAISPQRTALIQVLNRAIDDDAPYAAMNRANFRERILAL
jgi:uncharacterized protein (TIGR02646 family)